MKHGFLIPLALMILGTVRPAAAIPAYPASPAQLTDFVTWLRDLREFRAPGTETRRYLDVVHILYDFDNGRPWGDAYYPEAERRWRDLRSAVCAETRASNRICATGERVTNGSDIRALQDVLSDRRVSDALEARWGVRIEAPVFANFDLPFQILLSKRAGDRAETRGFWDYREQAVTWRALSPALIEDAANYTAGYQGKDAPALFGFAGGRVILNDGLIRDRAIDFAVAWQNALASNRRHPELDPFFDSTELQFQSLFDENRAAFEASFAALSPVAATDDVTAERFRRERAAGDFPEEVYQHVAYGMLNELVLVQSGFLKLSSDQRPTPSPRQRALESLLTLQRYARFPRIFLLEMHTRANFFSSHAAVMDQMADNGLASTFMLEQIHAILELDVYAGEKLFERFGGLLATPETAALPADRRRDALRALLTNAEGKFDALGFLKLESLFAVRASEADLRALADIVHRARFPGHR